MIYFHWIIITVYLVVIVLTMIAVLMDNRQPAKTMAWVMVLSFVPVVGIIIYFFFGQNFRKERIISQRSLDELTKRSMLEFAEQRNLHLPENSRPLLKLFANQSMALPFKDNSVDIYTDGYNLFLALLRAIGRAQDHIHIDTYIIENDPLGRLISDALIDKARQGVEVRFIYDDVGCWRVKDKFFDRMRKEGVMVEPFMPVKFPALTGKVNYRNHRKIVVIDGKVAFTGGMNIALRYMKGFQWGIWRDTHIKIEGKAVYGLQTAFLTDWYVVDRTLITSSRYFPEMDSYGNALMQIVTSDPVGEWRDIMQGLLIAISSSRKYFYIQTPYLLPTEPILMALKTAALAGVDIRIMIPERADTRLTHLASLSYLDDMMRAGVKIYLYQKGFLHSKLIVSDDTLSTVGSTNMDFRSFEHNFEVNAFMYDRTSALILKEIFLKDQKDAFLLQRKQWIKRPWYQKVQESTIRLLAPLL